MALFTSCTGTFGAVSQTLKLKAGTAGSWPTYSLSGTNPPGESFNEATGAPSGVPTFGTVATYPPTITATNALGSTTQEFTLTETAH